MAQNKHQHYLPAFYLYNFTNQIQRSETKDKQKRETKIYHFDISKDCIHERPIKKLAIESYLYSCKLDDGTYNHVLDNELQIVENKASIALQYFGDILQYALRKKPPMVEIDNSYMSAIIDLLFWQIKRHPDILSDLELNCRHILLEQGIPSRYAKPMALATMKSLGENGEYDIRRELDKKNMTIICTSSPNAMFITSDKPFIRFNASGTIGIAVEGTEMYFPISSNMLLWMHNNGQRREFRLENDRTFLRKLNSYIARSATNYLFGSSCEYLERIVQIMKRTTE